MKTNFSFVALFSVIVLILSSLIACASSPIPLPTKEMLEQKNVNNRLVVIGMPERGGVGNNEILRVVTDKNTISKLKQIFAQYRELKNMLDKLSKEIANRTYNNKATFEADLETKSRIKESLDGLFTELRYMQGFTFENNQIMAFSLPVEQKELVSVDFVLGDFMNEADLHTNEIPESNEQFYYFIGNEMVKVDSYEALISEMKKDRKNDKEPLQYVTVEGGQFSYPQPGLIDFGKDGVWGIDKNGKVVLNQ
jgi:hypothetical protein